MNTEIETLSTDVEEAPESFIVNLALPSKIYYFIKDLCEVLEITIDQWVQDEVDGALESWVNGGDDSFGDRVYNKFEELMKEVYPNLKPL